MSLFFLAKYGFKQGGQVTNRPLDQMAHAESSPTRLGLETRPSSDLQHETTWKNKKHMSYVNKLFCFGFNFYFSFIKNINK
jgi:hypothetical protein